MLVTVEPVDALWLVSVSASVLDFVSAFRRYADRQGIFVPTAEPLAAGKRGRIALTLADGQIMIEGEAEVVSSTPRPGGLHGRAGMTLRFSDLDEDSKLVIAHLEKARFASKVTSVPDNVRARPGRLPANTPTPAIDPTEKVFEPTQALARCLVVGNRDALADNARPKSATDAPSAGAKSGKFVMPSIPSPTTGRVPAIPPVAAAPSGPTRTGSTSTPPPLSAPPVRSATPSTPPPTRAIAPSTPPPLSTLAARAGTPSAPPPFALASPDVKAPSDTDPTGALTKAPSDTDPTGSAGVRPDTTPELAANPQAPVVGAATPDSAAEDHGPTEQMAAPTVTVLSPVILPPREPAVAAPAEPTLPTGHRTPPAPFRTMRVAAVPAPIQNASPFLPADTSPSSAMDDAEITSTTEIPLPPSAPGIAAVAESSAPPVAAEPPDTAAMAVPAAPAEGAAAESVLVAAPSPAQPGRRHDEINPVTGNWTIALSPEGPSTVVREPIAPQFEVVQSTARIGNAPLEISGALGGRADQTGEHRPVGTAPSIEIAPELARPSLQDIVARLPPGATSDDPAPTPPPFSESVDPYGATGAFHIGGEFAQPPPPSFAGYAQPIPMAASVAPPGGYATPTQGLAASAFGPQQYQDPRALTDAGTGFFQSEESADQRPRYATTGANGIIPERKSKRNIYIIAGAAALAIVIAVIMAMGGGDKKADGTAAPGSNQTVLGSGNGTGSAPAVKPPIAVDAAPPPAPPIDAAPTPVPVDAAAAPAATPDAAVDEPMPTSTLCTVKLNSDPTGAEVISDKESLGVTPISIDVSCDQPLKLMFRKSKWIGVSKILKPTRKGISFTAHLIKPSLSIKVSSTPTGGTISINGKAAGTTPTTVKVPGSGVVTISVAKKGYVTATKKHTPKANNESVVFTLTKSKSK